MPPKKKVKGNDGLVEEAVEDFEKTVSKRKQKDAVTGKWSVVTLFFERLKKHFTQMEDSGLFQEDGASSEIEEMFLSFKEWTKLKRSSFQYPMGGQLKKNKKGCPEFCSAHYQKSSAKYSALIDEYIGLHETELSTNISKIIKDLQTTHEENLSKIEKERTAPPTNLPKLIDALGDYNIVREKHNKKKSEMVFQTPAQNRGVQKLSALGDEIRKVQDDGNDEEVEDPLVIQLETNLSNLESNISDNIHSIVKKIQYNDTFNLMLVKNLLHGKFSY